MSAAEAAGDFGLHSEFLYMLGLAEVGAGERAQAGDSERIAAAAAT